MGDFALSILWAVMLTNTPRLDHSPTTIDNCVSPTAAEWNLGLGTRGATVTISQNDSKWLEYGLVGAVLGLAVGGFAGYWIHTTTCSDTGGCDTERHPMEGAVIGMAAGGTLGALVGLRESHRE